MMCCPNCRAPNSHVIDSRSTGGGAEVRRRRGCGACQQRWTTYEINAETYHQLCEIARARKVAHQALTDMLQALQGERP